MDNALQEQESKMELVNLGSVAVQDINATNSLLQCGRLYYMIDSVLCEHNVVAFLGIPEIEQTNKILRDRVQRYHSLLHVLSGCFMLISSQKWSQYKTEFVYLTSTLVLPELINWSDKGEDFSADSYPLQLTFQPDDVWTLYLLFDSPLIPAISTLQPSISTGITCSPCSPPLPPPLPRSSTPPPP